MSMRLCGGAWLNQQIASACAGGIRRLTVSEDLEIEATVLLPSDFHLTLRDCTLRMAAGTFCNMFRNEHAQDHQGDSHIVLEGINATLDGGEYNGLTEQESVKPDKPSMTVQNTILLAHVSYYEIKGLRIINQRWWGINQYACDHGYLHDLDFMADDRRYDENGQLVHGLDWDKPYMSIYVRNADGIDLRRGCHDILIENITGFTEDDTVAMTLLNGRGEKEYVRPGTCPDICNIIVRHIHAAAFCSLVRVLSQSDGQLHHVMIEDVVEQDYGKEHYVRSIHGIRVGDDYLYGLQPNTEDCVHHLQARHIYSGGRTVLQLIGKMRDCCFEDLKATDSETVLLDQKASGTNIFVEV